MNSRKLAWLRKIKIIALLIAADVLFFCLVNPTDSNSFVALAGCLLLALTAYALVLGSVRLVAIFIPISERSQRHLASFTTLSLIFLLLMQSIGQLSLRDTLAVVPLTIILYVYLTYAASKNAKTG
jgi:hypothetical protein